ncbi:hypothetical protein SY83_04040 [Paenibacillus swuensis]|uniref:Uncharacterized protein n=1 Tax=Paenibacillus swuensis TaxID=1178515 RepID=A0A172TFE9_9BACL|nr:hypothetical protein [Paenibacillus swuensis]ANE45607.1 hypothetical protein SY83_04040 [Paenibacillus swuensis]
MKRKRASWMALLSLCCWLSWTSSAQANWLDRIKDIYNTPEKVDQVLKEYEATKEQLEAQRLRMEEAESRQQELVRRNEELLRQNALLQQQMEALKRSQDERAARTRQGVWTVMTAALLALGYMLSVRIWRYVVWRRQGRPVNPDEEAGHEN